MIVKSDKTSAKLNWPNSCPQASFVDLIVFRDPHGHVETSNVWARDQLRYSDKTPCSQPCSRRQTPRQMPSMICRVRLRGLVVFRLPSRFGTPPYSRLPTQPLTPHRSAASREVSLCTFRGRSAIEARWPTNNADCNAEI